MKKLFSGIILTALLSATLTGCAWTDLFKPEIPDDWYLETLQYYRDGFSSDWKTERDDLDVGDEMKDKSKQFGYLLTDLDGDGAMEVLLGIMDDAEETKFIDVYIWHKNIGSFRALHAGEDYYIYLCENQILRMDSWRGSETEIKYMKYNSEDNAFLILDEESKPQKWELTPF